MKVGELFETKIRDRIEPVIKVSDVNDEKKVAEELRSYVVTPAIENYLDGIFDHFTDTIRTDTQEIGIWISGYFGSGKSYLAKVIGQVVENRVLVGTSAADHFKTRIPVASPNKGSIERSLSRLDQIDTEVMGLNLLTIAGSHTVTLAKMLLTEYYAHKGYTRNLIFARVIEAELDRLGKLDEFRRSASEAAGKAWADVSSNPNFYRRALYSAAVKVAPANFPSEQDVENALKNAEAGELYNTQFVIGTIREDLERKADAEKKPQRFMFVLDEFGFWAGTSTERLGELDALVQEAALTNGMIWLCVTTHGDMGSVIAEARMNEADQKKIVSRFRFKPALTTENIELVLEDRLFKKTAAGRAELEGLYGQKSGTLRSLGEPSDTARNLASCTMERFATYYPFLPYQVELIPEVVKSLRSKGGRGEQLSGSTRTLLAVVQDILRSGRRDYLEDSAGVLVSFDEVYHNLASEGEVQPDVRDDVRRIIDAVPDATLLTQRVAETLYLAGHVDILPGTIDNLARLMAEQTEDSVASVRSRIEPELQKLINARLAVRTGEEYEFLTGEVRTFEDDVAAAQADLRRQDKVQGFQRYFVIEPGGRKNYVEWLGESVGRLEGRDFPLKITVDGVAVTGTIGDLVVSVVSPMDATSSSVTEAENATVMSAAQNTVAFVMDRPITFDDNLSRYLAMRSTVERWKTDPHRSEDARKLASDKESNDLRRLKEAVLRDLKRGLQDGYYVFRGSSERLAVAPTTTPADALHERLTGSLEAVYPRYRELAVRVAQDAKAVEDALAGKTSNQDLRNLGIYDVSGDIKAASPAVDTFVGHLSTLQARGERVHGQTVATYLTGPPFGWDPHVARIVAAALARQGRLTVVVQNKKLVNPEDEALKRALRGAKDFSTAVLELEGTEPNPDELRTVRQLLISLSGNRHIIETPAAVSEAAGLVAQALAAVAEVFNTWCAGASFDAGLDYSQSVSLWAEVELFTQPNQRIQLMSAHLDELKVGHAAVTSCATFERDSGVHFVEMRGKRDRLVALRHLVPEGGSITNFLDDFARAKQEHKFLDPEVWARLRERELQASNELRDLAKERADEAISVIEDALARLETIVASEGLDAALLAPLSSLAGQIREMTHDADRLVALDQAENAVRSADDVVRAAMQPVVPGGPEAKRIRVRDFAPLGIVKTEEDWNRVSAALDESVRNALNEGRTVEFDY